MLAIHFCLVPSFFKLWSPSLSNPRPHLPACLPSSFPIYPLFPLPGYTPILFSIISFRSLCPNDLGLESLIIFIMCGPLKKSNWSLFLLVLSIFIHRPKDSFQDICFPYWCFLFIFFKHALCFRYVQCYYLDYSEELCALNSSQRSGNSRLDWGLFILILMIKGLTHNESWSHVWSTQPWYYRVYVKQFIPVED